MAAHGECCGGYDTLTEEIIYQNKELITVVNGDAQRRVMPNQALMECCLHSVVPIA